MGNHHGNQCHVTSSRSPGSLPFLFFCFFSCPSEERRGEEEKRDEGGGKMRGEDLGKYDKGSGAQ